MYYRGANAAILVYDITSEESFLDMNSWIEAPDRRVIPLKRTQDYVSRILGNNFSVHEASAKDDKELGINFGHIKTKSLAVLNPLKTIDKHIMDDTDLAGPLIYCLIFGVSLLLTGKAHFGYIYGVALLGWLSIYLILNLMSDLEIDIYRTASVLGYCLLPLTLLSCIGIGIPLW
ncbi:10985_t:CDS:2 [Entrophospora sp. SA101]|nr:10985_t:CDS:2 [Entrophospora sp. SA101]